MERDADNDEVEDKEEEDEEKKDQEEMEEEDEDEEEDKDEDNGKEPRTIGQGEMVNTLTDNADTMVDVEPTVLPEPGREMREHSPRPQPPGPSPCPKSLDHPLWPQTPETHTLSGLEFLGLLMPQKPCPAAPTLPEAETAGNTSDIDVEQQLVGESPGGDSLPDVPLLDVPLPDVPRPNVPLPNVPLPNVPLPNVPLPDVPLPNVPLPNVPLPNVPLPNVPLPDVPLPDVPLTEARADDSGGEEWTSPRVAFGLELGSCLVSFLCYNLFISGTDSDTRGGVLFVWVRVVGLFVFFVLIY